MVFAFAQTMESILEVNVLQAAPGEVQASRLTISTIMMDSAVLGVFSDLMTGPITTETTPDGARRVQSCNEDPDLSTLIM